MWNNRSPFLPIALVAWGMMTLSGCRLAPLEDVQDDDDAADDDTADDDAGDDDAGDDDAGDDDAGDDDAGDDDAGPDCGDGDVDSQPCDPGTYCPTGEQTRDCEGDTWGDWSDCEAGNRYFGDGSIHCGDILCLRISASGSDTSLNATVSLDGGGNFPSGINLYVFRPSTSNVLKHGPGPTAGQSSYDFTLSPAHLGFDELGVTDAVNVQAYIPWDGNQNHISGNAFISQCAH